MSREKTNRGSQWDIISNIDQSFNLGHIGPDPLIDWLSAYINLYISTNDFDSREHSETMRSDQKDHIVIHI